MSRPGRERLFLRTGRGPLTWPPPDRSSSLFVETDPAPMLREHVAKLRWGHERIAPDAPIEERIIPDGATHLLFVLSNEGAGGPYGLALGATSEPTVVRLSGRIELRPGAAAALLGVPAAELAGRVVSLSDLWGDRAAVVRDRLADTPDPHERIQIVTDTLAAAVPERPDETPAALGEALRRIRRAGGNLRVRDLAAGLGITDRRLEQLFHRHVGLSPKASCRLARFQASVNQLADAPTPAWAELALDRGFSDQPHLVNEFRAFTGLTPNDFQRRAGFGFLQDRAGRARYLPGKRPGRSTRDHETA